MSDTEQNTDSDRAHKTLQSYNFGVHSGSRRGRLVDDELILNRPRIDKHAVLRDHSRESGFRECVSARRSLFANRVGSVFDVCEGNESVGVGGRRRDLLTFTFKSKCCSGETRVRVRIDLMGDDVSANTFVVHAPRVNDLPVCTADLRIARFFGHGSVLFDSIDREGRTRQRLATHRIRLEEADRTTLGGVDNLEERTWKEPRTSTQTTTRPPPPVGDGGSLRSRPLPRTCTTSTQGSQPRPRQLQ